MSLESTVALPPPREFDLPSAVLTTQVGLATDVGRSVYIKPLAQKVTAFWQIVRGSGHLEIINIGITIKLLVLTN